MKGVLDVKLKQRLIGLLTRLGLLRPGGKAPVRSGEKPVRPKKKTIRNTHRKKNS